VGGKKVMVTSRGVFISFEGIEGSGKSTQARLFARRLARAGRSSLFTREPGGTRIGREIRRVLLNSANRRMVPEVELALYFADRAQHLREVVRPALAEGRVVVSDRFTDSTIAYQGHGRGLSQRLIGSLDRIMTGRFRPRFTVLLDLPPEEGLRRARKRNRDSGLTKSEGRFELERLEFHRRVRKGYLRMARRERGRFLVVPASGSSPEVHQAVWRRLAPRLGA